MHQSRDWDKLPLIALSDWRQKPVANANQSVCIQWRRESGAPESTLWFGREAKKKIPFAPQTVLIIKSIANKTPSLSSHFFLMFRELWLGSDHSTAEAACLHAAPNRKMPPAFFCSLLDRTRHGVPMHAGIHSQTRDATVQLISTVLSSCTLNNYRTEAGLSRAWCTRRCHGMPITHAYQLVRSLSYY